MTSKAKNSWSSTRYPGAAAIALAATAALVTGCGSSSDSKSDDPLSGGKASGDTVVVGSNNFAESTLLADIYGEALKAKGVKVTYKPNIGSRETTYGLLKNGSITVLPEYNGALLAYLDPKATPATLAATTAAINAKLDTKLTLLDPAAAEDKDTVTLNAETAKKYNLTAQSSIGDLKSIAKVGKAQLTLGIPPAPAYFFRQRDWVRKRIHEDCPVPHQVTGFDQDATL